MTDSIKKILVPVDFSDNSLVSKKFAETLAKKFGAEIKLLHVVESSPYEVYVQKGFLADVPLYVPMNDSPPTADPNIEFKNLLQESEKQLNKMVDNSSVKCSTKVRNGHAVDQILEEIKEYEPDLLLMCTHGWTGLKHLMLGSVTEKLVRLSPVPVLTTRGESK